MIEIVIYILVLTLFASFFELQLRQRRQSNKSEYEQMTLEDYE